MPPKAKRSAKRTKSPELTAGSGKEQNGPFQDQEIILSNDKESQKRELQQSSNSSESEDVDMESDSEQHLPRGAVRAAAADIVYTYHLVLTREQTRRRQKADEADRRAKQKESDQAVAEVESDKPVESSQGEEVEQSEAKKAEKQVEVRPKNEVVIVGTMRFMPPIEIAEEVETVSARRIFRRTNGKMEPTTAVVLTCNEAPPSIV